MLNSAFVPDKNEDSSSRNVVLTMVRPLDPDGQPAGANTFTGTPNNLTSTAQMNNHNNQMSDNNVQVPVPATPETPPPEDEPPSIMTLNNEKPAIIETKLNAHELNNMKDKGHTNEAYEIDSLDNKSPSNGSGPGSGMGDNNDGRVRPLVPIKKLNRLDTGYFGEKGVDLSDDNFELRWLQIYFEVFPKFYQFRKQAVTLLNNVSGTIKSGQLVALMGPSGSGKSTLLDCVAGRRPYGISSGSITVTGQMDKIRIALVPQQDEFYDRFSVVETLMYASKLKNPAYNLKQHKETVNRVMRLLGLDMCENVKVLKCSGGQQKRISIAQELVSRPNILLLDEPTSGLDSSTCYSTLLLLQKLAHNTREPMAIMISIHQPSARMFNLFDSVYFMAHRGMCCYEGTPTEIPSTLSQVNLALPPYYNPADFMMEVASHDYGSEVVHKLNTIQTSRYELTKVGPDDVALSAAIEKPNFPFIYHTWLLFHRGFTAIKRDPILMGLRLAAHIIIPVFLGILFGQEIGQTAGCPRPSVLTLEMDELLNLTQQSDAILGEYTRIIENCGFLYLTLLIMALMTIGVTVLTFPLEGHIFMKEHKNGWYSIISYFIGRSIAEFIFQVLFVIIYVIGAYLWTGQIWDLRRFAGMTLIIVLANLLAQSISLIVGAMLMNNIIAAVFMSAVVILPLALYTSFFVRVKLMTWGVRAIAYMSFFHYSFEALVSIIYGFDRCVCEPRGAKYSAAYNEYNSSNAEYDYGSGDGDYGGGSVDGGIILDGDEPGNYRPGWVKHFGTIFNSYLASNNIDFIPKAQTGVKFREDDTLFDRFLKNIEYSYLKWTSDCDEYQPVAMAEFSVSNSTFWYSVSILLGFLLVIRVAAYCVLLWKVKN